MVPKRRNVNVDPVKRRVISELFFAPSVVLPIVGGISAGLVSWATGGISSMTIAAAAGVLGGVGWMMTRILFKIESITEDAMRLEQELAHKAEIEQLDQLHQQLINDGDDRTQNYLTLLRSVREDFQQTASQPGVQMRSARVREQLDLIFHATVDQLRHSYKLWELSQSLSGEARRKTMVSREGVMKEIEATVDRLHTTVLQFKEMIREDKKVDLASMREELEATMRVARRTEEKMRDIENLTSSNRSSIRE